MSEKYDDEEFGSTKSSNSFSSERNELEKSSVLSFKSLSRPRVLQTIRSEAEPSKKVESVEIQSREVDEKPNVETNNEPVTPQVAEISDKVTQTEWSWIQDMQLIQRIKRDGGSLLLNDILDDFPSESEEEEAESESEQDEEALAAEAKAKAEAAAARKASRASRKQTLDTIGPPKILKYLPETQQVEIKVPTPDVSLASEPIDNLGQFMKDFNVIVDGGQQCEFCGNVTKPWPTINLQEVKNPETLFCCNDYQEFVQALIEYRIERDQVEQDANERMINRVKNEKARELVKERAELRNMRILMAKQRKMEALAQKKREQEELIAQQKQQKEKNKDDKKRAAMAAVNQQKQNEQQQQKASQASLTKDLRDQITSQVRSINYQLSNLKYLQDGWTVRPTSPLDFDEMMEDNEFNLFLPVDSSDRPTKRLVIRNYKNGQPCLLLFPDGTGTVFYPSGRIALVISSVATDMHIVSLFNDDESEQTQIGYFDPFGNGSVDFPNGKIRMILTPLGGVELSADGMKKKRWTWWDPSEHVHAPPFQPIIFAINSHLSAKVINQEKITINFYAENQVCKFRVGARIKLIKPEQMPSTVKQDPHEFYLKKKKSKIDELLGKMCDEMNFVKLPKIGSLARSHSNLLTNRSSSSTARRLANKEPNVRREKTILFSLSGSINENEVLPRTNNLNNNSTTAAKAPAPQTSKLNQKLQKSNSSKFLTIP